MLFFLKMNPGPLGAIIWGRNMYWLKTATLFASTFFKNESRILVQNLFDIKCLPLVSVVEGGCLHVQFSPVNSPPYICVHAYFHMSIKYLRACKYNVLYT